MLKLEDFFGLVIDDDRSNIIWLMELLGIRKAIDETKVVKALIQKNGRSAPIVAVARRQQVLKLLKPLLDNPVLEYEASFYTKEINTSSDYDRRYGAEERLLEYALLAASTKSKKIMNAENTFPSVKQLREAGTKETRFDRCWDILADETEHIVSAYRKSKSD